MKTINKMYLMTAIITLCSFGAFAGGESNAVKKAKVAVEEAKPYDWKTLAKSAQVCFKKGESMDLALEWINKSIEIHKDPFNLEVKADYYSSVGENQKALELYQEAIVTGKEQNFWFDSSKIQAKIWTIRSK